MSADDPTREEWLEACHIDTGAYVAIVLRDFPDLSVREQLAKVMKLSKGAANPNLVLRLLTVGLP